MGTFTPAYNVTLSAQVSCISLIFAARPEIDTSQLKRLENTMTSHMIEWSRSVHNSVGKLGLWVAFGRVIGAGTDHGSESLRAFSDVVKEQLRPLWADLDTTLKSVLIPLLAALVATAARPRILLAHIKELPPNHEAVVHTPYAKAKPTLALLKAKQEYTAISAQLRDKMPKYLELMDQVCALAVRRLAMWQAMFWREVTNRRRSVSRARSTLSSMPERLSASAGSAGRRSRTRSLRSVSSTRCAAPKAEPPNGRAARPPADALAQRAQQHDQPVAEPESAAARPRRAAAAPRGVRAAAEDVLCALCALRLDGQLHGHRGNNAAPDKRHPARAPSRSSLTRPRLSSRTQPPDFAQIKELGTHPRHVPGFQLGRQNRQVLGGNA